MSVCNTPKRGLGSKIVEVLRRWGRSCTQKFGFGELRKLVPSVISTRRPRVTFHCLEFVLSLMCLKIVLICIRRSRTQSFSYACANIVTAVLTAGQAPHAFAYARAFFVIFFCSCHGFRHTNVPFPKSSNVIFYFWFNITFGFVVKTQNRGPRKSIKQSSQMNSFVLCSCLEFFSMILGFYCKPSINPSY